MAREADRQKFVELAQKRMTRALRDIRLVGNLSNRSNYMYTDEDARKIYRALREAVEELRGKFERTASDKEPTFRL